MVTADEPARAPAPPPPRDRIDELLALADSLRERLRVRSVSRATRPARPVPALFLQLAMNEHMLSSLDRVAVALERSGLELQRQHDELAARVRLLEQQLSIHNVIARLGDLEALLAETHRFDTPEGRELMSNAAAHERSHEIIEGALRRITGRCAPDKGSPEQVAEADRARERRERDRY